MARVDHVERKTIRTSRDLIDMAELGMVCPEYKELPNDIKSGIEVESPPSDHILRQFVRKTKITGELKNVYDEMYIVDTRNGKLVRS